MVGGNDGVAGAAGAFGLALLSSACLLLLLGTGSLFGLTAHTWRMINTLAALHIRSACREDVLPVAEHPHTLVPLCVLNYVCFMIYLTHPCKNVERASFRQYVLSAFVCLAASPRHTRARSAEGEADSTGLLTTGRLAASQQRATQSGVLIDFPPRLDRASLLRQV